MPPSTSGKKEAEGSEPLLSLEKGAAAKATAAVEESAREPGGRQGGKDFVTSPRVPGRNAKRPVRKRGARAVGERVNVFLTVAGDGASLSNTRN